LTATTCKAHDAFEFDLDMGDTPRRWVLLLTLLTAACGDGGNGGSSGPAPIDTLAYIVTQCHVGEDAVTVRQDLRIRRGEAEPVTVTQVDIGPLDPATKVVFPFSSIPPQEVDLAVACRLYGQLRLGSHSVFFFFLQDVAVSPDGTGVVFEVTDNFSSLPAGLLPATDEGVFFVRSDGTGLRRIADARTEPSFVLETAVNTRGFAFSPNGRTVVFVDNGSGPEETVAPQIFTVDVVDGTRRQITRLPPSRPAGRFPPTCCAGFVGTDRIGFSSTANPDGLNRNEDFVAFTLATDGSQLATAGPPVALPGSVVLPTFSITGEEPAVTVLEIDDGSGDVPATEVFFIDGEKLLQLTNFGRSDTITALLGIDSQTAFFAASADPDQVNATGTNPTGNCQLFSVSTTGGMPHQLTNFREGDTPSVFGCLFSPLPGCAIGGLFQDPKSGTLVFHSSCDPLGSNPTGDAVFAMRPDGTGLQQITFTRGRVMEGSSEIVELPGPYGYRLGPGQRPGG
jgi:hypothetical protein